MFYYVQTRQTETVPSENVWFLCLGLSADDYLWEQREKVEILAWQSHRVKLWSHTGRVNLTPEQSILISGEDFDQINSNAPCGYFHRATKHLFNYLTPNITITRILGFTARVQCWDEWNSLSLRRNPLLYLPPHPHSRQFSQCHHLHHFHLLIQLYSPLL